MPKKKDNQKQAFDQTTTPESKPAGHASGGEPARERWGLEEAQAAPDLELDQTPAGEPQEGGFPHPGLYPTQAEFERIRQGNTAAEKEEERPDETIQAEVWERLNTSRRVIPDEIEVKVKKGIVTLKGKIQSEEARLRAEEVSRTVMGVKAVANKLKVRN